MVLSGLGFEMAESELRRLCDCTAFGSTALTAVDAARGLGFAETTKQTLSIDELAGCVDRASHPIVLVNTLPIDGLKGEHAFVVLEVDDTHVVVADPLSGERRLPRATFETAWAMMHNLAILIEP